ncbi:MAG TPA: adenylate/guanylate cyclase domain-containing protein [Solirubrobacteraceae bacterium]|nr:adenylate/guanylate cyclase domain-containing protein [Solirubrobacteraceae bacterium]
MEIVGPETCPLPHDPVLAATAAALNDAGHWAEIVDPNWGVVYMTDEARWMYGGKVELAPFPLGGHVYGAERVNMAMQWRGGQFPLEVLRRAFAVYGPWILADTPGGHERLRELVDPRLEDIVGGLVPVEVPHASNLRFRGIYTGAGAGVEILINVLRLRDATGAVVGTASVSKPAVGMAALTRMTALGDLRHFERMDRVAKAGRRAAAVLFADLESSSPLSRKLSTARYFALVRRLARAADQCVVEAGGLVGTHAGDGIVAFFLAETSGSDSAAARACIAAARAIRAAVGPVAARSELPPGDVVLRFGLHWGANLYVGQIATSGRTEVTALGDQVNETARIEACATGGRALASKDLVERLGPGDAGALELHPDTITYSALGDLATATEKARRDAPAIAVCEI